MHSIASGSYIVAFVAAGGEMTSSTWVTAREMPAPFCKNPAFAPRVKARTQQPLLLSRLLYNAHTRPPLLLGLTRRLNGAFLEVLRMVANTTDTEYAGAAANMNAVERAGMLPLSTATTMQRLALLMRLREWASP